MSDISWHIIHKLYVYSIIIIIATNYNTFEYIKLYYMYFKITKLSFPYDFIRNRTDMLLNSYRWNSNYPSEWNSIYRSLPFFSFSVRVNYNVRYFCLFATFPSPCKHYYLPTERCRPSFWLIFTNTGLSSAQPVKFYLSC